MNKPALTNKWFLLLLCLFSLLLGVFITLFLINISKTTEVRLVRDVNNDTSRNILPSPVPTTYITDFKKDMLYIGKYKGLTAAFWQDKTDPTNYWVSSDIRVDKIPLSDIQDVRVEIPYPKNLIINTNPIETQNYYYIHAFENRTPDDKERDLIMKISKLDSSIKIVLDNTMPFMSLKCNTLTKVNSRTSINKVIDDTYIVLKNFCLVYGDVADYSVTNPKITIYNMVTDQAQDLQMDIGNIEIKNGYIEGNKVIKVKSRCVQIPESISCPEFDFAPEGDLVKIKLTI